jgi:hypothetical protein
MTLEFKTFFPRSILEGVWDWCSQAHKGTTSRRLLSDVAMCTFVYYIKNYERLNPDSNGVTEFNGHVEYRYIDLYKLVSSNFVRTSAGYFQMRLDGPKSEKGTNRDVRFDIYDVFYDFFPKKKVRSLWFGSNGSVTAWDLPATRMNMV